MVLPLPLPVPVPSSMNLHVTIVEGISDLKTAVSIISGVTVTGTGMAKVIIRVRDEWSSFQVVKRRGNLSAELRLFRKGFDLYDFKRDGDEQHVCNYGIGKEFLVDLQEFVELATEQDGFSFSITYNPISSQNYMNILLTTRVPDPYVNPNPQVGQGQASSFMPSTARKRPFAAEDSEREKMKQRQDSDKQPQQKPSVLGEVTIKRSLELPFDVPTGSNAPTMADENHYRVTASLPSESFFNILKGTQQANALTVPGIPAAVLHIYITITRKQLVFLSRGINVSLKQENGEFKIQGAKDDEKFKLLFLWANLKPLKEATSMPGTGRVAIHVDQDYNPLLKFPVGDGGQLGNLFFSGL